MYVHWFKWLKLQRGNARWSPDWDWMRSSKVSYRSIYTWLQGTVIKKKNSLGTNVNATFFQVPTPAFGQGGNSQVQGRDLVCATVLAPGPSAHATLGAGSLHDSSPRSCERDYL